MNDGGTKVSKPEVLEVSCLKTTNLGGQNTLEDPIKFVTSFDLFIRHGESTTVDGLPRRGHVSGSVFVRVPEDVETQDPIFHTTKVHEVSRGGVPGTLSGT